MQVAPLCGTISGTLNFSDAFVAIRVINHMYDEPQILSEQQHRYRIFMGTPSQCDKCKIFSCTTEKGEGLVVYFQQINKKVF